MRTAFLSIPLALCALFTSLPSLQAAGDSLYDATVARKPTDQEAAVLGPQASHYRYDGRLLNAARIAQARANRHSTNCCWRYVKTALLAAGAVDSYPKTAFAKQAAQELPEVYGFKRLHVHDPFKAPLGSVLVYGGQDAGHVEIRTETGYASDFTSPTPYDKRPLIGVYIKPKG